MKHHVSMRNSCLRGNKSDACCHFMSTMNGFLSDRRSLSGTNLVTNAMYCGNTCCDGTGTFIEDEREKLLVGCSRSRQKLNGGTTGGDNTRPVEEDERERLLIGCSLSRQKLNGKKTHSSLKEHYRHVCEDQFDHSSNIHKTDIL